MISTSNGRERRGRGFVSIRFKLVLALLLATVPMVAVIGYLGLESSSNLLRTQAMHYMQMLSMMYARRIEEAVGRGIADAGYLARAEYVRRFAQACSRPEGPPAAEYDQTIREFAALADATGIYCQVRYLDSSGRERARVEYEDGHAHPVSEEELQDKGGAYYFREAIAALPGHVYVSDLDLNREFGRIERPLRPVIRFAAPVVDDGERLGVVVLNLVGDALLPSSSSGDISLFLADAEGWYLHHTDARKAWSGPRNLRTGYNLWRDIGREAAVALQPRAAVIRTRGHLLATWPILASVPPRSDYLILGVDASESVLFADLRDFRRWFWTVLAVAFVGPVLAGLVLATYFLRPVRKLREAVHQMAGGDLAANVKVTSRDEFQELAEDFNAMARRLRKYRQQERLTLIGRVAASIIHDIRNPLNSITVFVRLLAAGQLAGHERDEMADKAVSQVRRIVGMLQEILDFSRGQDEYLETQPVSIMQLLDDVRTELEPRCEETGTELVIEQSGECELNADPGKLRRAILNVTSNALEAMGRGGTLTIGCKREDGGVRITIADTGPGVAEEVLDRLFDPFVTHGKSNGTGLGLPITKAIVEAHGGRLQWSNRPEGGAEFAIWLPVNPQPPKTIPQPEM